LTRVPLLISACLLSAPWLRAASVSGTVKDPSGGLVSGAAVSLQRLPRGAAMQATTDAQGRFRFAEAAAGSYSLQVTKDGFEPWERTLPVAGKPVDLTVTLKLKVVTTSVQVSGRRSPLANSDPNYRALRSGKLTKVYLVSNLVLQRDVGTFTFRSGSFSFLPPVLGQVATGVFVGEGNFQLKPAFDLAVKHLHRIAGIDSVDEDFTAMVVYFSDFTFEEVKQHSTLADQSPERHEEAFQRVKNILEQRRVPSPVGTPLTLLERLLNYEDISNYDAEILAELYNAAQRGSFRAFLHGRKHSDLRFLLNPRGAMPMLPAPEETALLNFDPASETDGIWYLSHLASELQSGRASSQEDKRLIAPEHYQMQIAIANPDVLGKEPDLGVTCDLRFRSLDNGTRMVKFDLVPDLEISRVAWNGKDIPFIQENRTRDGSFYLQMPEPLVKGRTYQVTFEYSGGEILQSRFGNVPPRRIWYPTPAGPASRATYDLTFHAPRGMTIVSVGKQVRQTTDGAFDVTEWSCDVPIVQAVFRTMSEMFAKTTTDKATNMELAAYVIPATIRAVAGQPPPPPGPPSSSAGDVLIDTGNSVRVFTAWFGPPAYKNLSVVVGTATDSLPGLIYALRTAVAGYSSLVTEALVEAGMAELAGGAPRSVGPSITAKTGLDEAYATQVSRQWWGNTVSPVSFHDQWLSSGFANFSASLYDLAVDPEEFRDHWVKAREAILSPPPQTSSYGRYYSTVRPNDIGPIWMGVLNETFHTAGAGNIVSTSKGGYILHMLRAMMHQSLKGDADFRAMMQDFVKQYASQAVSTEDFKLLVEKHMKPPMDVDGNHRMDWFFDDWVYGTDIPSYRLEYSLAAGNGGQRVLTGKLTQSGVSPGFRMLVPLFAEFPGNKAARIAVMAMRGNSTRDVKAILSGQPRKVLLNLNYDVLTDKEEVKLVK
jgi:hypothetical protein